MSFIEVLLVSFGVSMDSFSMSVCKGLSIKKNCLKKGLIISLYFAVFQGGMPLIGYYLGKSFESFIVSVDHWIAFILLSLIGLGMIGDFFSKKKKRSNDKVDFMTMLPLALAISIDALTIGITFVFLDVNEWMASFLIGITTFVMSMIGVKIGNVFGRKFEKIAKLCGGIVLVVLGIKILTEHLM